MNWTRVKIILIFLFACINIFLIAVTYFSDNGAAISHSSVNNTIDILKKRGIKLTPDKVDTRLLNMNAIDVQNISNTSSEFINNLIGSGWVLLDENTYARGNEQIKFNGNSFSYNRQSAETSVIPESDAYKAALAGLGELGFSVGDMRLISSTKAGEETVLRIGQVNGNYFMFDSTLDVTMRGNIILSINGSWNEITAVLPLNGNIESSVKALIEFSGDKTRTESDNEIVSVTAGYKINNAVDYQQNMTIQMLPAWRIITNTDAAFYYDARAK